MGMLYGSMRHTSTGRKKKTNHWTKTRKTKAPFVELKTEPVYYRETPYYPSADSKSSHEERASLSREEKLEISSNYTVAPAYNKGAYQVISKENIEHIGK